ncbi:MAG: ATP-binding protein [Deltaproteobacteria bacterium]|nr:ATP-binding protein [Deltaproteobacteria bacterium]
MYIQRGLAKILGSGKKSFLLLGPRQTGKSTLISRLKPDLTVNLADETTYLEFARNPSELKERLAGRPVRTVFIDEIQRLPSLLNTLQDILDHQGASLRFFLTGSSARKLKRGGANLLPGRIHSYHLGPLASSELDYSLNLLQSLATGTLPGIYTENSRQEQIKTLRTYAATYLKEEIQAEALTRNLEGFSRFLFVAAQGAGHFLDLNSLASEAHVPRQSAVRYFEILEDTLVVQRCLPFSSNRKKRLVKHPKFYFFDTGVLNALLGSFEVSEDRKGLLFEHLFFNQLVAGAAGQDADIGIYTYRTEHGAEVDFIVENGRKIWALEVKASKNVGRNDLTGLKNFSLFLKKPCRCMVAYWGDVVRVVDGVTIMPWQQVLKEMGL